MGKKKFIDKKNSATFQLLARDSSDPSYDEAGTNGPSGEQVFVRVDSNPYSVDSFFNDVIPAADADPNDIYVDAPDDYDDDSGAGYFGPPAAVKAKGLPDLIRKEILELGFPDDGYNYLIHLREIKNAGGGSAYYENPKAKLNQLPRDVKAYDASRLEISKVNEDSNENSTYSVASKTVGVRIQKVVDPEVAALLDDSDLARFGSDVDDLEEDFVIQASIHDEKIEELDTKLSLAENFELTEHIINAPLQGTAVNAVVADAGKNILDASKCCIDENPRPPRLLDEQFDLLQLQEYGTDNEDQYDDYITEEDECHELLAEKLSHAFKDHVMDGLEFDDKYRVPPDLLHENKREDDPESMESAADVIQRCREYAEKYENENHDENVVVLEESSDESEVWDCETIVSTYSNLDNHPGKIEAPETRRKKKLAETSLAALGASGNVISLKGRERLPLDFLPRSRKTATEKVKDVKIEQLKRKQHGQESKVEKKERKAAVKEERREARRAKKEIKGLYRGEAQHAQKVAAFTGPSTIHLM